MHVEENVLAKAKKRSIYGSDMVPPCFRSCRSMLRVGMFLDIFLLKVNQPPHLLLFPSTLFCLS